MEFHFFSLIYHEISNKPCLSSFSRVEGLLMRILHPRLAWPMPSEPREYKFAPPLL